MAGRGRIWRTFGALALVSGSLAADENTYLPDYPGKVAVTVAKAVPPGHRLGPAEAASYAKNMARLRELILARPQFQSPVGATLKGYFRADDNAGSPRQPVPGFGFIRFHPMMKDWHTGAPVAFIVSTWEIEVRVNRPALGLELVNEFELPLYVAPTAAAEVDGVTVYTGAHGNELLVFTRSGQPPWVPVTGEEYAGLVVAHWKKLAEDPMAAPVLQPFVAKYEAWRAALTPEQRGQQARRGMENAAMGVPRGPLLVKTDPAWFDPALPRSAFQLITLLFDYSSNLDFRSPKRTVNPAPLRVWEALHESPWAELKQALTER